ncbi:zinc ribbon domain-containing protein [Archaeoglobus sulfaticallidus]|nr:zinc ribbon domain-containing protein [Archaeoglobus sulfaticallidus]
MKLVTNTFKGSYKARHIPKIDVNDFPIRLTYGEKHLFYFVFDGGLKARISLPNGRSFKKEEILIHNGELNDKLSELTKHKISDSLLFPDYRLLITLTKEVEIDYVPENAIGVDIGIINLITAYCNGKVLQISGEQILEAHKKGVEHRRLKQKLGSRKFTYNESKFVRDYVYHAANQVIEFAKQFEKPVIVLEDLKWLKRKLKRLPHIYTIAPYELIHSAIVEKALWEEIAVQTRKAYYSSQKCPVCKYVSSKNRKGRRFKCLKCGFEEDVDVVAGMNLSFFAIPPPIKMGGTLAR